MKYYHLFIVFAFLSCSKSIVPNKTWTAYDETSQLASFASKEDESMRFKLIQSKNLDKNEIFKSIYKQIVDFTEDDYMQLLPYILDKDILSIQNSIDAKKLNYEKLTKWYLYRILKFESNQETFLNAILSINENAVNEARACDRNKNKLHPIYGMPILLKDNINTKGMPTTAGAVALKNNTTGNAFIVDKLESKGAIILGKANLSEWAYFLCENCPSGYSALGGQTLNPYGRFKFHTGGSSSGSGVVIAANYAVAAVGSETSGSIISPASQNSIVGLKPTIGQVSRSGIIPISSTLDTAGPMTKNVVDAAILLSAIIGYDKEDSTTVSSENSSNNVWNSFSENELKGKRFGVFKAYLNNTSFKKSIDNLRLQGAEIIEIEEQNITFNEFVAFLNADMKVDLPKYLKSYSSVYDSFKSVSDIINFNKNDINLRIPYGQALFEGIEAETISEENFEKLKNTMYKDAVSFFEIPMRKHNLDAVLSINNYNSAHAAMAKYPCLTIPMGYLETGEPIGITFIAKSFEEDKLLKIGYPFEKLNPVRISPKDYK